MKYIFSKMTSKTVKNKICGWTRPPENALEEEKALYNATLIYSDTMYCHHLSKDGKHCVLNNLPSTQARRCGGIMYVAFDWGVSLTCDNFRPSYTHTRCTEERCPYMKETGTCPYMPKP